MPSAFGTNCWLGIGEESVYGTYVAPTQFVPITEDNIALKQNWISKPTLSSASQGQKVRSKKSVGGSFKLNASYQGIERILKHAFGSVNTGGPAAGLYNHTATLTNALPTGLSLHVNRDAAQTGGSAYTYEGCQITSLTITQEVEDLMTLEVEVMGEDGGLAAVATPTFPQFQQIDWEMPTIQTFDGAVTLKTKSFNIKIENNLIEDRYKLGARTRIGLGRSGPRKITGSFTVEHESTSSGLQTYWQALSDSKILVFNWSNGLAGTANRQLQIVASVTLTGNDPPVKDSGVVNVEYPFEAFDSGSGNTEMSISILNTTASPT